MSVSEQASSDSRSFLRKAATVASGQAVGYGLALAASPLLSRLYSPRDFGLMAVFVGLMGMLGTVATFRFDNAIPLPEDEHSAETLATLAKWTVTLVTACLLVVAVSFGRTIDRFVFHSQSAPFSLLLAAAVAVFANCQIHGAMLVRQGKFAALSRMRLCYATSCLLWQLAIPVLWVTGPLGLLAGQVAGYASEALLFRFSERRKAAPAAKRNLDELRRVAVQYRVYPLVDVSSSLLRVLAVNGQALMIAWTFGVTGAGCLALAQRLIGTPLSMLSYSLSRVYYSEAARLARVEPRQIRSLFVDTSKRLALLAGPPLALVCLVAPWTFGSIFGAEWRVAGLYCSLLCPLIFLRLVSFVLAPTLDVIHRQGLRLMRELNCAVLIASGVIAAWIFGWGELAAVAVSVALGCLGHAISILLTWQALLDHEAKHVLVTPRPQHAAAA